MTTLHIDLASHTKDIADLYGIFFEDLNHAADGGLYGELVRNRAFEFCALDNAAYDGLTAWEPLHGAGEVKLSVVTGAPVDSHNPHYLALDVLTAGDGTGFKNLGYNSGIPLMAGASYRFSCYARREQDNAAPLTAALTAADGTVYTSATFHAGTNWKQHTLTLTAPVDDASARLAIIASGAGRLYFDFVSLFPLATFRGRINGLRADLAERLAALHPRFMRFPGGCLVHDGALDDRDRGSQYRWKNSVGPLESRPARRNNWGYNQSLGLGFYEYFLLCEDIGARPLPVLPAGYDPHHRRACPMEEMQPFVQDALDLIDFANGDDSTEWGRRRAELGHPAPFGLVYLGIGNEEVGADFPPRFKLIRDAVKRAHPEIRVIGSSGPFAAGGEFARGWNAARADDADLVDEHYYMAPEWFLAHTDRYRAYPDDAPKVFLGEYASWGNRWQNALAEAAYMTALEQAPAVTLACYAPLFCNVAYANWKPDLIFFDNHRSFVTANYEVQRLFMHNTGTHLLAAHAESDDAPEFPADDGGFSGEIGVEWISADADYRDITLTEYDAASTTRRAGDASSVCGDRSGESATDGCAHTSDGISTAPTQNATTRPLADAAVSETRRTVTLAVTAARRWTLRLTAHETTGKQGFRIYFGKRDATETARRYYWELGGWQNQDATVCKELRSGEPATCLEQQAFSVQRGQSYQLELRADGRDIRAFVDGQQLHSCRDVLPVLQPLYWTASADDERVYLKAVNVTNCEKTLRAVLSAGEANTDSADSTPTSATVAHTALVTTLTAPLEATNSFDDTTVAPETQTSTLSVTATGAVVLDYTLPAHTVAAFRIARR